MGYFPLSLLFSSLLCVAAGPAPAVHEALTPANFKDTISTGTWLIEHYSPYCRHCKDFAPTWDKLVAETEEKPNAGIYMAQVNCAVNGDLCTSNGVTGYPQLMLYKAGTFVETYKGSRDHDILATYLAEHTEHASASAAAPAPSPSTSPVAAPAPIHAPALHVQAPRATLNPDGMVQIIKTTSTLDIQSALQAFADEGPLFVKYYAPWCGHCKKLEPHWKQLAKHAKGKVTVAQVNCDDDKDKASGKLCQAQGVEGYPSLFFYKDGMKTDYTGARKIEQLKAFIDKAGESGVRQITAMSEIEAEVAQNDVAYLLLQQDPTVLESVTQASSVLLGSPVVLASDSVELFSKFGVTHPWALLAFKDHDLSPVAVFHGSSLEDLKRWLLAHRLPTTTELTQDTFQSVMNAAHKPIVVIAAVSADNKEAIARKIADINKVWRLKAKTSERDVVFAWMDAGRWKEWMKKMYGITLREGAETPVVVADHSGLVYWNTDAEGRPITLTATSISSALEGAQHGNIKPLSSESFIERTTRSINAKIISLETFVVAHPFLSLLLVVGACAAVFFWLRNMINSDIEDIRGEYRRVDGNASGNGQKRGALTGRKAGRLD